MQNGTQNSMLKIAIMYGNQNAAIEVGKRASMEELKVAVFSVTNIDPEYQLITRDNQIFDTNDKEMQLINFFHDEDFILVTALPKPFTSYNGDFSTITNQESKNEFGFSEAEKPPACSEHLFEDGSCMMVKYINPDNSCLFAAIHYAENQKFGSISYLREQVANYIVANPYKFPEQALGRSPDEYVEWIMEKDTWGGEVELIILAEFIEKEIAVINTNPWNHHIFGQGQNYRKRIYLLYNGAHYNLIVRNFSWGPVDMDVTIFRAESETNLNAALQAAEKFMLQNGDNENIVFYCRNCEVTFVGKSKATAHGQETHHSLVTQSM